ncbi:hypothetical protein [Pedobacter sp.]
MSGGTHQAYACWPCATSFRAIDDICCRVNIEISISTCCGRWRTTSAEYRFSVGTRRTNQAYTCWPCTTSLRAVDNIRCRVNVKISISPDCRCRRSGTVEYRLTIGTSSTSQAYPGRPCTVSFGSINNTNGRVDIKISIITYSCCWRSGTVENSVTFTTFNSNPTISIPIIQASPIRLHCWICSGTSESCGCSIYIIYYHTCYRRAARSQAPSGGTGKINAWEQ